MAEKATYATGRRKTSSARVFLYPADKDKKLEEGQIDLTVNKLPYKEYFPRKTAQMIIAQPLEVTGKLTDFRFVATVSGGGDSGQAGAVRHGIARALEKENGEDRAELKKAGFLTRDPRAVERKKPGRHKARKKPQFSKR